MDMAIFILGLCMGSILTVVGSLALVLWIMKDNAELRGCNNCKYHLKECQGREYCEAWEELE